MRAWHTPAAAACPHHSGLFPGGPGAPGLPRASGPRHRQAPPPLTCCLCAAPTCHHRLGTALARDEPSRTAVGRAGPCAHHCSLRAESRHVSEGPRSGSASRLPSAVGSGRCTGRGPGCPAPPPAAACQETTDGSGCLWHRTEQGEEPNGAAACGTKPVDPFKGQAQLAKVAEALLVWCSSTVLTGSGAACGACDSRALAEEEDGGSSSEEQMKWPGEKRKEKREYRTRLLQRTSGWWWQKKNRLGFKM